MIVRRCAIIAPKSNEYLLPETGNNANNYGKKRKLV
jgi:hypothetical protein